MKKLKPAMLALALCGILSMGPASCPKKESGPTPSAAGTAPAATGRQPQPPQKIHDRQLGITLLVPADWIVSMKPKNPVIFATAPGRRPHGPLANVVVERLNKNMNPYDYLMANIPTMRISLPGLIVVQGGIEPVGATSTAWIHYTYPRSRIVIEAIAYCRVKGFTAYVVTTVAPADEFEKYEPLFRTIGRSLRID